MLVSYFIVVLWIESQHKIESLEKVNKTQTSSIVLTGWNGSKVQKESSID